MEFSPDQLKRIVARLGAQLEAWLAEHTVEKHYSAASLADLLEVAERSVENYLELYETSGGREGIGPYVKISHKVKRVPASSVNRFLRAKTIDAAALAGGERKAA